MDILKRLSGECGTPVCMPATWKMLKKRFLGKVIHCISAKKKTYFKIHARSVLSVLYKGLYGISRVKMRTEFRENNEGYWGETRRNRLKSAGISQTQRKEYTRPQVSLFQFICGYSPKIWFLI